MEKENTGELFSIKLTAEGIDNLLKLCGVVKTYIILGIIFTFIILVNDILLIFENRSSLPGDVLVETYFKMYPFLSLVTSVFFVLEIIAFWRFRKELKSSLMHLDETGFNNSLIHLRRALIFSIVVTSLSFIFLLFNLLFTLRGLF